MQRFQVGNILAGKNIVVINRMIKTRLKVLKYWLEGQKNNVSFSELVGFFFGFPYSYKAKAIIDKTDYINDYIILHLKGYDTPLYYPKGMSLKSLRQVIVESFYKDNWHYYQIEETMVGPDDIVVDCGAAEGLFSLIAASVCKKVYAIEPLPKFIEALKLTFSNFDNVEIIPCAVSSKAGEAFISETDISSSLTKYKNGYQIRVETMDSLFFQKDIQVSYIKADLEGYDFEAIKGAKNIISKYCPKIAITTYHNTQHSKLISDFIMDINPHYKIKTKGIFQETGSPVMLHAWGDRL